MLLKFNNLTKIASSVLKKQLKSLIYRRRCFIVDAKTSWILPPEPMLNNKILTTVVPDGLTKDRSCNHITKRKNILYAPFEAIRMLLFDLFIVYLFSTPGCSIQLSILFGKIFGRFAVDWRGNGFETPKDADTYFWTHPV